MSVTNQKGILSGVATGTLKPLSEVERSGICFHDGRP